MTVKVDLSTLFQNTDWPTELSQEQRQKLLQEKILRAQLYRKLAQVYPNLQGEQHVRNHNTKLLSHS